MSLVDHPPYMIWTGKYMDFFVMRSHMLTCCSTVQYKLPSVDAATGTDALDDVTQVLLIMESVIEQVYGGQRKLTLTLTRQLSQRLKKWADQRLSRLDALAKAQGEAVNSNDRMAACQALAAYYYTVTLLSRPFLMYESYHLIKNQSSPRSGNTTSIGRRTLADGCVDAAACVVNLVLGLIQDQAMPQKMPLLVYVAKLSQTQLAPSS